MTSVAGSVIRRGRGDIRPRRDDALVRVLIAGARRDAALTRGALRRAATGAARVSKRELAGARAGLAPVRREMRRIGGVRTGTLI